MSIPSFLTWLSPTRRNLHSTAREAMQKEKDFKKNSSGHCHPIFFSVEEYVVV